VRRGQVLCGVLTGLCSTAVAGSRLVLTFVCACGMWLIMWACICLLLCGIIVHEIYLLYLSVIVEDIPLSVYLYYLFM